MCESNVCIHDGVQVAAAVVVTANAKPRPAKVAASGLSNDKMGCAEHGQPTIVIRVGMLRKYVGIGWINLREACEADYESYPEVDESK